MSAPKSKPVEGKKKLSALSQSPYKRANFLAANSHQSHAIGWLNLCN
ncbi:hypothetical protein [Vibrio xiamenensis]|nr:hypothetical protein [Vibrio xiamenensis]